MIYNSNRKTTIAIRLENKSYHDCCCKIIFWFIGSPQAHTMPHPVHRQSLVPSYQICSFFGDRSTATSPGTHGDRHPDSWQHRRCHHISRDSPSYRHRLPGAGHCFPGNCFLFLCIYGYLFFCTIRADTFHLYFCPSASPPVLLVQLAYYGNACPDLFVGFQNF